MRTMFGFRPSIDNCFKKIVQAVAKIQAIQDDILRTQDKDIEWDNRKFSIKEHLDEAEASLVRAYSMISRNFRDDDLKTHRMEFKELE